MSLPKIEDALLKLLERAYIQGEVSGGKGRKKESLACLLLQFLSCTVSSTQFELAPEPAPATREEPLKELRLERLFELPPSHHRH